MELPTAVPVPTTRTNCVLEVILHNETLVPKDVASPIFALQFCDPSAMKFAPVTVIVLPT